jgi:hypothetical protein
LDEIFYLGLITGLVIVGFSKLRVEDERIAAIRFEALQWGIYANCLALVVTIVFVYDIRFLFVMIYNMFTPLLILLARFYWLLRLKPAIEAKRERSLL